MARPCKICQLEESHPDVFEQINKSLLKGTNQKKLVDQVNKKLSKEIKSGKIKAFNATNISRHKPHVLGKEKPKTDSKALVPSKKNLTKKEKAFVQEYPKHFNGSKAARDSGYSIKTARQIAHVKLSKADIREAIEDELKAREARTKITQDMVVHELALLALGRYEDVATWDEDGKPTLKPLDEMNERGRATLKSIKHREVPTEFGKAVEIDFSIQDKKGALAELLKHTAIPFYVVESIEEVTEKHELDIFQQIELYETLGYRVPKHLELAAKQQKEDKDDYDLLGDLDNEAFEEKLIERKKKEIIAAREAQLAIRMKELDQLNREEEQTAKESEDVDQEG